MTPTRRRALAVALRSAAALSSVALLPGCAVSDTPPPPTPELRAPLVQIGRAHV